MENVNDKLTSLFECWERKLKEDPKEQTRGKLTGGIFFTKDGVMNAKDLSYEQWLKKERRVAFILKDQYQRLDKKGNHSPDNTCDWTRDEMEKNINNRFFVNLRNILWGILHTSIQEPCDWNSIIDKPEEIKEFFFSEPYAYIESKKTPGKGSLSDKILKHHIDNYGDKLWNEIEILNPNFIICTHQLIYEHIIKKYQEKYDIILKTWPEHGNICYDAERKVFIIRAYHPSQVKDKNDNCSINFERYYKFVFDFHLLQVLTKFEENWLKR